VPQARALSRLPTLLSVILVRTLTGPFSERRRSRRFSIEGEVRCKTLNKRGEVLEGRMDQSHARPIGQTGIDDGMLAGKRSVLIAGGNHPYPDPGKLVYPVTWDFAAW
jgi:hypothetical protein